MERCNQIYSSSCWLEVFGQVDVVGRADARISAQTLESFTPELASTFKGLFTTVFGRRLGTIDDGTALRASPQVGSDDLTSFPSSNRDLTLERINTICWCCTNNR